MEASLSLREKLLVAIGKNLPPEIADDVIIALLQDPKRLREVLKETLTKSLVSQPKSFRTIILGTYESEVTLVRVLKASGFRIGHWADDLIRKPRFTMSPRKTEVLLAVASVTDLGFRTGGSYRDICARALELGLEFCPAEVGPQLRLQYDDQPFGEWLRVAMEPILDSDGHPGIFTVCRDYIEPWLRGSNAGRPETRYGPNERFVFVLPK